MEEKVLKYIKENNMINNDESVVVGVSGGSDSMCLLSILQELKKELKLKLYVVHIHHGIRGKDADEDMLFVENYCRLKGITCFSYRFDVINEAKNKGLSTEEAGRILRYEAFSKLAKKYDAKIAVAHNMSDNVETVLFNMFRGSGIKGLTGIAPVRDNVIRPILCLSKEEIYAYLEKKHIDYRVDKSNFEEEYTRNKIRLKLIPYITENINEKAMEHINELSDSMNEMLDFIEAEGNNLFERYVTVSGNDYNKEVFIDQEVFSKRHILLATLVRRCIRCITGSLKDITRTHIENIIALKDKQVSARLNLPYDVLARRTYEGIEICKRKKEFKGEISEKQVISLLKLGSFDIPGEAAKLCLSESTFTEEIFKENIYTKWISYDILKGNLSLRTRRTGDYIVVDDKGSRKKLKDYLINEKVPKEERDNIWLLANGHEIVWIVGHRLGANYKIDKNSENVIKVEFIKYGGKDERKN